MSISYQNGALTRVWVVGRNGSGADRERPAPDCVAVYYLPGVGVPPLTVISA